MKKSTLLTAHTKTHGRTLYVCSYLSCRMSRVGDSEVFLCVLADTAVLPLHDMLSHGPYVYRKCCVFMYSSLPST